MSRNRGLRQKRQQIALKKDLVTKLGGKCENCSYKDIRALDFHHINPELKSKKLREARNRSAIVKLNIYKTELDNIELLCANCHRIHSFETVWKNKYGLVY